MNIAGDSRRSDEPVVDSSWDYVVTAQPDSEQEDVDEPEFDSDEWEHEEVCEGGLKLRSSSSSLIDAPPGFLSCIGRGHRLESTGIGSPQGNPDFGRSMAGGLYRDQH